MRRPVVTACAGAIEQIGNRRLHCVPLDLSLEGGDGAQVLRTIADARFAGSIVVVSGMDSAPGCAARLCAARLKSTCTAC